MNDELPAFQTGGYEIELGPLDLSRFDRDQAGHYMDGHRVQWDRPTLRFYRCGIEYIGPIPPCEATAAAEILEDEETVDE